MIRKGELFMNLINQLLTSTDDVFEQIRLIKENKDQEQVKKYLILLDSEQLSPYMRYLVDKYLFNRKVGKEPKMQDRKYSLINYNEELLEGVNIDE